MNSPQAINKTVKQTVPAKTSTGKKDCTFCKPKGFRFLPLRYAVVCGIDDAHASMWPALAHPLGDGVADKKLANSRYTVRLLREGYVYVLVERGGEPEWQGYAVTAAGLLARFPVGKPPVVPPVFTCDLATDGVGASLVSIEKIESVKAIHVLFSPDVLPESILDKRAKDKLGMQVLPPHGWQGQSHVLQAAELDRWVAEFKLNTNGMSTVSASDPKLTGRQPFAQQLYPLMGGPGADKAAKFDDHLKRLTALKNQLSQLKSPALVLWDPIGITQELNLRHRSLDVDIQKEMKPYQWELETSHRIAGLKQRVMAQAAVPPSMVPSDPEVAAKIGINPEYDYWKRNPERWVKASQDTAWGNYESLYDEPKRAALVTQLDTKLKPWFDDVEKRFVDLKVWLTSQALTNAFESYHPNKVECGLLFEYQSSLCTYALATSKGGEALLREWTKDVNVAETNLLNRQMLLNQKAAIDEFKKAAGKLKGMPDVDSGTLQQMVSSVTGMIDKANAIVSGLGKGGVVPEGMGGVAAKFLSGALFFSTIGQTAFAPTAGAVNKLYAFVIYVRGGAKAYLQGAADAMIGIFDSAYVSKAGNPIDEARGLRTKLTEAAKANTDDHAAMRFGTALALIESWNLGLKYAAARGKGANARESWDLYAAIASTSAAIAVSVANLTKVVKLSTAWVEHLSLSSGVLGGFAAGVSSVESLADAGAAFKDGRTFAGYAFIGKAAINGVAAAGSLYVGTLYSAPLLKRIGESLGERWMGESLTKAGEWISKQALKETVLFGVELAAREAAEVICGFIGWALIVEQVGELAILALSDNKMQVWLTRCRFRKPQAAYGGWGTIVHDKDAGKPYDTLEKEGTEFDAALKAGV